MPQHGQDRPGENGAQIPRGAGVRLDRDRVAVADQNAAGARQHKEIFAGAAGLEDRRDVIGPVEPRRNLAEPTIDVNGSIGGTIPFRQGW